MSDNISRAAAIEAVAAYLSSQSETMQEATENATTILSAVPDSKLSGTWEAVTTGEGTSWTVRCSNCHMIGFNGRTTYCPNCGCKME